MKELIKINYTSDKQTTSARSLWEFLDKPYDKFTKWFNKYKEYGFIENQDYRLVCIKIHTNNPKNPETNAMDYEITIEMAKELAMLQKTEKGKTARRYFIDLEKKWNSPESVMARALQMADSTINQLQLQNNQQKQIIGELKPKADYVDKILHNKGLVTITQIAKDYGFTGNALNKILHQLVVQYKQSGQWLLYKQHQSCGYTHSQTIDITRSDGTPDVKMNTKWTQKGRLFLYNLLKDNEIYPLIEQ